MRVLLLGGNGLFGHRIGRLFALHHHPIEVLVGCRNESKAQEAAQELQTFANERQHGSSSLNTFIPFSTGSLSLSGNSDYSQYLTEILQRSQADLVVNTVGPFVFSPSTTGVPRCFTIAEECAKNKIHYVDLADEREYLNRFVEYMDPVAKENNVCLITGASTTPGITMQAIELLAQGTNEKCYQAPALESITSVEWALSPGNKIGKYGSGSATVESILRTLGKPISGPNSNHQSSHTNSEKTTVWSDLKRYPFKWLTSSRYVARVDQVDIDLVNQQFPQANSKSVPVRCYAGIELSSITWALHVLASLISWFPFLRGISIAIGKKLTPLTRVLGSDTGAFTVRVDGKTSDGATSKRSMDLLAEGDGPFIPAIPSVVVATKLLQKQHQAGAFVCGTSSARDLFSFEDFTEIIERNNLMLYWSVFDESTRNSKYLYKRIMGSAFYRMPAQIQDMHSNSEDIKASGTCRVVRGKSVVSRIIGYFLGLADEGEAVPTTVNLVTITDPKQELWIRNFSGKMFRTVQRDTETSLMRERVGVTKSGIQRYYSPLKWSVQDLLTTDAEAMIKGYPVGLEWNVKSFHALGGLIRLPQFLSADTIAEEKIVTHNGKEFFQFNVKITLPLNFGLLVHYRGTLEINGN